jgi:hypothetical protein
MHDMHVHCTIVHEILSTLLCCYLYLRNYDGSKKSRKMISNKYVFKEICSLCSCTRMLTLVAYERFTQ